MNILVAIDFSDKAGRILDAAKKLAHAMSAKVSLVHIAEPDPDFVGYKGGPDVVRDQVAAQFHREHRMIQDAAESLRADGIDATALLAQGPTVETILDIAKSQNIDLLIMGSHGRGAAYDVLVGSVSKGVIRKANCPVTLVSVRK